MYDFEGTGGRDRIRGSYLPDTIDVSQGGNDSIACRGGDDVVYFGAAYTMRDRVNGGKNSSNHGDTVILEGDYSAGAEFTTANFRNVENLVLQGGSYRITGTLDTDGQVGRVMFVDATGLLAGQSLDIDVAAPHGLRVWAGAGDDTLRGASDGTRSELIGFDGDDLLIGTGHTLMDGTLGADRMVMSGAGDVARLRAGDSLRGAIDTVENFEASGGRIQLILDLNTATPEQDYDFHLGETPGHAGDVLSTYNAARDITVVKVFTDSDGRADLIFHLTGHVDLTPADFIFGSG